MLKDCYRLRKRRDFSFIYNRGKSRVSKNVAMSYSRVRNKDELLIGFSASKKVGNAVIRNRVKRLMREYARLNIDNFPKGYRIIFNARVVSKDADYRDINRDMRYLIKHINIINNSYNK